MESGRSLGSLQRRDDGALLIIFEEPAILAMPGASIGLVLRQEATERDARATLDQLNTLLHEVTLVFDLQRNLGKD